MTRITLFGCFVLLLSSVVLSASSAIADDSAPRRRVAVAPFAGDTRAQTIADGLSNRLAARPLERVIGPRAFVARAEFEPRAAQVRQWAYNAAVDAVVVGRVEREASGGVDGEAQDPTPIRVEVVLRSGHSGAELARRTAVLDGARPGVGLDALARRLVEDLGVDGAAPSKLARAGRPVRDPRSPEPPLLPNPPPGDGAANVRNENSSGLDDEFALGRLREDVPIEIKADEAEIQDRGADRKLVFQRNVRVRQGDVTLESDELEAQYQKGQSEPDRLIARGSVRVDQGYRRANCDRAIYLRVEQRLMCQGRALLVQGCDVVRGDSIEFDLASDRAEVRGAASIVIRPGESRQGTCAGVGDVL